MNKEKRVVKWTVYGLTVASILVLIYYVLNFTELYLNSDGAAIVLLAKEMLEKKQFFPDGFCYSTGLFVVSPAIFIAPLMKITGNWLLCRKIAMLIFIIALFALLFLFCKKINVEKKNIYAPFVAIILMCLPMGHYQETYFAAGYISVLLGELLILLFFFSAIEYQKSRGKKIVYFAGLLVSVYIFNIASMHYWAIIMIPLIVAIIVFSFVEYCRNKTIFLKNKKVILSLVILIVGLGLAYVSYQYLMEKVGALVQSGGIVFSTNAGDNLLQIPRIIFSFYNSVSECELLSLRGIMNCVNFVVLAIATFVVPLLSIVYYGKIRNSFLRLYIIYTWISDFIVLYMIVFTTAIVAGDRYYQTIFFHKLILMSIFMEYLLKHKIQVVRVTMLGAIVITFLGSHIVYAKANTISINEYKQENQYSVVDYLKDNNLTYGYATFWNAYKNMVLANGDVVIAGVNDGGNTPFYWLTSRDWYNTDLYSGRCFYLLSDGEIIDRRFYEEATEIRRFKEYTILIFEQNVLEYSFDDPVTSVYDITAEDLSTGDNAYIYSGEVILKSDGIQYGPSLCLNKGMYEAEITGDNLEQVTTEVVVNMNVDTIPYRVIEKTENKIVISFEIQEDGMTVEIVNENESDKNVRITRMHVEKML